MHFWLHHTAHWEEKTVSAHLRAGSTSAERGGGWGHPQGDMHMVAARLGCERAMVGTGLGTSHPDCTDRPRKHYSHLAGGWFLARKAAWALSGCTTTYVADYCMLVNEWTWSNQSHMSAY